MPRKPVVIVSSIVAHTAAVVALIIAGWWNIEKLEPEAQANPIAFYPAMPDRPMPGGGDGKPAPLGVKKKGSAQRVHKARTDVQPALLLEESIDGAADIGDPDAPDVDGEFGDPHGSVYDRGTGFKGTGDCRVPECGSGIPTDVEIEDPPDDDKVVPPDVMTQHRKSDGKIPPPDSVMREMQRAGESRTSARLKICVSPAGAVRDVTFVKRTGYDAYDAKLLREISGWRYTPFTIDGKAVPACAMTEIIFHLR